ncbi:MAG: PaaI family thioesterase [Rhodospirillales bacterium]|nr:PaaI family thioesterase [Rhodospirillales bacterium]
MPKITPEEIHEMSQTQLPWAVDMGFTVDEIGTGTCRVRMPYKPAFVRPGGTVAGPLLMGLADFAMYVAVLSEIGRVELAVTTNLTCNFLRRPKPRAVIGEARLLKLGKRLAVGEVSLFTEGEEGEGPVAHVTATYSIPPER